MVNNYVEKKVRSPISYYGGKAFLCRSILQIAPPHHVYCEPFCGGCSVLLNKFRSDIEIASDLNSELINFYNVLTTTPEKIIEQIRKIPFGRETFYKARAARYRGSELDRAVNFLIRHRMSYSGIGATWAEGDGKEGSWETLPHDLAIVAKRLQGVKILLRSVFDVIPEYDSPDTFFYLDPPYYQSTRVSPKVYTHELPQLDHLRLLRVIRDLRGHVILSGYDHHMYNSELPGWERIEIDIAAFSSPLKGQKSRRTEILWVKPHSF